MLVLSNLYPPVAMGGYELSCRDVVDRWRRAGHDVTVLTTSGSVAGVVEPLVDEPHVRRQLRWYWAEHAFLRPHVGRRLAWERHNHRSLLAAVQDVRPDVVSVWHMGGMSLSLLTQLDGLDLPVVYNVCDDWPDYGPRVDAWSSGWGRLPAPMAGLGARLTGLPTSLPDLDRHQVSFVSAYTRDHLRASTPWAFPRSTVVGSGVDTVDFPIATHVGAREWTWDLLVVGRVDPRKGFDSAVRALQHLPAQARLRIAGVADPSHTRELMAVAAECGVADRLVIAAVPRAELRRLYASASVLIFPSRWHEPFGLVPLEAMTQATPVVATRRGGSAEFLADGENCLEVPVDAPLEIAQAVHRLAGDPGLRVRLAEGGLRTATRFTTDRLAQLLEQLHLTAAA